MVSNFYSCIPNWFHDQLETSNQIPKKRKEREREREIIWYDMRNIKHVTIPFQRYSVVMSTLGFIRQITNE